MRGNSYKQGVLPGMSLVEVLVVLAVVASSMVAVAGVNIRAQIALKDNEIIDTANSVMIQALELAKSPAGANVVDQAGNPITGNISGTYNVESSSGGSSQGIVLKRQLSANRITSCNTSSNYIVNWNTSGPGVRQGANISNPSVNNICVQVIITQQNRPLIVDTYYEIESIVVFNLSNGQETNEIIGYRRPDYSLP